MQLNNTKYLEQWGTIRARVRYYKIKVTGEVKMTIEFKKITLLGFKILA